MAREAENSCPVSVIIVTECPPTVELKVTLPEKQVKFIDKLIRKKLFHDRSQVIEEAVKSLVEKQNKDKT